MCNSTETRSYIGNNHLKYNDLFDMIQQINKIHFLYECMKQSFCCVGSRYVQVMFTLCENINECDKHKQCWQNLNLLMSDRLVCLKVEWKAVSKYSPGSICH